MEDRGRRRTRRRGVEGVSVCLKGDGGGRICGEGG